MTVDAQVVMDREEIDDFLGDRHVANLTLARGNQPYSVPITYAYDGERFYFRLILPPGSNKRRYLSERPAARLVVYEESPPRYRSVIADGTPKRVTRGDVDEATADGFGAMGRPLFELWREPTADLDIQCYVLEPAKLNGRRIDVEMPIDENGTVTEEETTV